MASILRSSKFVRYIAGFARHIVVNPSRELDGQFFNTAHCFCGAFPRSLATEASAQHDQNLDRRLRSLDQDVRRSGRISRRDIDEVLEEIRQQRSATSSQSLLVIRCCGNLVPEEPPETRTKLVEEIWSTLNKLNVPMDISHYNALLRVYLENEHTFSPTEFLSDLESKGIEPNRVTYQRLIARYCQIGDIEGATRILEYMKEKQLPVNENVFNALINGHFQAGDVESAKGILAVMAQAGLEPSADTYTTLLCGYAKLGDLETIQLLLQECEEKEIFLLDKDLLDIIYSLAINGHPEHITEILLKTRKAIGYNQDAVNVIFRLINKNQEDAGYKLLKSMTRATNEDGSLAQSGHFFIKQLVKANKPVDKILQYSNLLKTDGLFDRGVLHALEISLQLGNEKLAYQLLEELQKTGIPPRQHFFWPLLVAKANESGDSGLINVLSEMTRLGVPPTMETIRDYVLPHMKGKSSEIIAKLRQANISIGAAAYSLVHSLLLKNDIAEAAAIASKAPAYYFPDQIRKPLTQAFYQTKDLKSYITIIRHVYENLDRRENFPDKVDAIIDKTDLVGKFLHELALSPRMFLEVAEDVLEGLVNLGLSISATTAEKLEAKLGEKMTPEISTLLGKLSSGELTPTPIVRKAPTYTPAKEMNIPQLERLIHNLDAKQQDTIGLKKQLFNLYYREKNLDKMVELLKTLEQHPKFTVSTGIYAQLLDTYAHHEKLEESLEILEKLKNLDSNYFMDEMKLIRLVSLLIKNDRFEEAIEMLKTSGPRKKADDRSYAYNGLCWRLLNMLAEQGKAEQLDTLFNTLSQNEFINVNNVLLGPLIKVHLINDNVERAIERFEYCCTQFKATPWKNELTCKLIQSEDAEKLQKLTDLSTLVHGEINSLYDLVFSFVECGRTRQARKILETPGLQSRPNKINTVCQRYQMEGRIKPLEGLKDATKDLNHIDRSDIYYQLLLSYIKQEDTDKAIGLWTQMQEESMAPTDEFLLKLGGYLKANNLDVPFVMPEEPVIENVKILKPPRRVPVVQTQTKVEPKKDVQLLRQALKNGDVNAALEIKQRSKENFNSSDLSLLVEKLIQNNQISEAAKLVIGMLDENVVPITRVFRFLLNKLATAGDFESIELIGSKISADLKKLVSFDNRICHANLVNGNAGGYLDKLEKEIDEAKDEELNVVGEKFPRGGAVGILERHPELEDKYKNLAVKYAKRGIIGPVNVLWAHYFVNNKYSEAESLWKDYLQGAPRVMFQRVVQHAREIKDEVLTQKLIEHLKTSKVTEGAIGNAYSCLLDVLVLKEKNEEVVATFENAVKDVNVDFVNRTAVLRVKEVYEKLGKDFTHRIPAKINNSKNQNLSSGSDDEHHEEPHHQK